MIRKPFVLLLVSFIAIAVIARSPAGGEAPQTVGLFLNEPGASEGYTLFAPVGFPAAYLIDNDGRLVHSWDTEVDGPAPYLLEDGSLIRPHPGGARWFEWDGTKIWDFNQISTSHHDIEVLPNGNVLMIVNETKSAAQAIAAGRDPALLSAGQLQPDSIVEIQPTGPTSGQVVWEWHPWDHLVQDHDPAQDNYEVVADHPELIDINFFDAVRPADGEADWHHTNAVDYNEELDQIVISVRHFSELWVIDHSTTTEEAASHTGGDSGKGGDLLYRWGNPQAYRAGGPGDQQFFQQHDSQWIDEGLPGAGNILVFNNGVGRPGGNYSSVDEIVPPAEGDGNYALTLGESYGPAEPIWTYAAAEPSDFFSIFISGAGRLPNGNTLIDSGQFGDFFEVTAGGETVWRYVNPVIDGGPLVQGDPIPVLFVVQANFVFRVYRYAPDYPGLQGRDLTPGEPIELPKGLPGPTPTITPTPSPVTCLTEPPATPFKQPHPCDTDGDGCSDAAESGLDENEGGRRRYTYFWDFFDVWTRPPGDPAGWHRDRAITLSDILAIVLRFGRGLALGQDEALAAALTPPSDATSYHAAYDRGPIIGATDWDRAPPDGVINIPDDILGIADQFGHDCTS